MRWGILFRKEITLTYARIQDIHLQSNFVERWLGLARIQIQTASGSAKAEMTIEGIPEFEVIRDFLYSKMRGIKAGEDKQTSASGTAVVGVGMNAETASELTATLREIAGELRGLREDLSRQGAGHD